MSGRLAITPGFEAPLFHPASATAAVLPTTAAKATAIKSLPAFASLIQELAQEAATRLPAASPKTAPRASPQSADLPDQPAAELPAARLTPAPQAKVEATPDVSVKDRDKVPAASPTLSAPALPEGTRRQPKSEASGRRENSAPVTIAAAPFMPVAPPMSLKLPSFLTHFSEGTGDLRTTSASSTAQEQTLDLRPAPALEMKIRAQDQPTSELPAAPAATPASKPAPTDQQTGTELPSTMTSGTPLRAEQIVHAFANAPGPAAIDATSATPAPTAQPSAIAIPPAPVNPPQAINTNTSSAPPPPASAPHFADEPVSRQPEQHAQPLRSLSLEFAPDGAEDVRVRVTERAGDVHISLHSTDPALSGRLSDGVHELVGTLTSAGYDAQAWTQGQGRQNHNEQNEAPPDDPRRNRDGNSADQGAEDFDALMQ